MAASGNVSRLSAVSELARKAQDAYLTYSERDYSLFMFCDTLGNEYLQVYREKCQNEDTKEEEEYEPDQE